MMRIAATVLMAVTSAFVAPLLVIAPAEAIPTVVGSTDACGVQPLKDDGTPWRCTFQDDFSGSSLDRTKWVPQTIFATGGMTARACYLDSPKTIEVASGSLNLTVRKLTQSVTCSTGSSLLRTRYVAGMVTTHRLFSQMYGRFEARIKTPSPKVAGLHEAFWMWPDNRYSTIDWPDSGEIDVSETYSNYPTLSIPYLHYSADSGGAQIGLNTAWDCAATRGAWTTHTVVWGPNRIEILVDGKSCLVNTSGDSAFAKRYIMALTVGLGSGKNGLTSRTPLPATTNIDYVRAWQ